MVASSNELLYFIELANTLNFSRASERIGISQPSLSAAIKRLEHSIGTELFIRDKHKVILSQAGQCFLLHAKQLLHLWHVTKTQCLASQDEVQGEIIVGCHHSIALYFLPKFLPALLNQYPKLEIHLKQDLSRKIAEQIVNFSVDIGLVVNPIQHPDLVIKKLFDDQVGCWQSKDLTEPTAEKIILCDPELRQTQVILKQLTQRNIRYKRLIKTNNLEVIARLTAEGVGIGILPGSVVKTLNHSQLVPLENSPVYHDDICCVYRHENRNTKSMQVMIEAIKNIQESNLITGVIDDQDAWRPSG